MKTIAYPQTMDRTGWDDGPWMHEPDKLQWRDLTTGLPCLIVRNPMGSLCGYVGVPEGHPWFGCGYDEPDVSVHGGLTFADFCQPGDESHAICHRVEPGEPDRVWWFGFDCGHAFDVSPGMEARTRQLMKLHPSPHDAWLREWRENGPAEYRDVYRDLAYVQAEVTALARQLWRAGPKELAA